MIYRVKSNIMIRSSLDVDHSEFARLEFKFFRRTSIIPISVELSNHMSSLIQTLTMKDIQCMCQEKPRPFCHHLRHTFSILPEVCSFLKSHILNYATVLCNLSSTNLSSCTTVFEDVLHNKYKLTLTLVPGKQNTRHNGHYV